MAKKNKNQNENAPAKEGLGTKLATFIIILIITVVWLAILALLIRIDAGGLGTTLRPYLEEVPYLKLVLPPLTDEEIAYRERYPYKNIKEAVEHINYLEKLVDKYSEENDDYAARLKELQEENDSLQHFSEEYDEYLRLKEEFDRKVIYGDKALSSDEFIKWFEAMRPETAAKIYEELAAQKTVSAAAQDIATVISKMKAKDAAKMLEEFTSDVDFICRIFECLKVSQVSDILTQMTKDDSLFAARVTDQWDKYKRGE
ncbi:MAG: hypothetical protein K6G60_08045 [Lachnospiraceae bacterium]|nr:hypothetical protein [Lachnospiraceae bacterium]